MQVVMVGETGANQAFVYRSNKLREAIGASHLVALCGTTWLHEAIHAAGSPTVEIVVSTSGKCILVGEQHDLAGVARQLTSRVLTAAPGLSFTVGTAPLGPDTSFFHALRDAFANLGVNRSRLQGPDARFQRLPIVDSCGSTGSPANTITRVQGAPTPLSYEAATKRNAADAGLRRLTADTSPKVIERSIDRLDDDQPGSWVAVVHADGNGLGQLFLAFDEHLQRVGMADVLNDNALAIDAYRRISSAVEQCTASAFRDAVEAIAEADTSGKARIVPVLLGGDDLTAVMSAPIALAFTEHFLHHFATHTGEHPDLEQFRVGSRTASAAIIYTKPHFPYWASYEIAAELLSDAKTSTRPATNGDLAPSVVDLHMVYDSSAADVVDARRHRVTRDVGTRLWGGPYLVQGEAALPTVADLRAASANLHGSHAPSSASVHEVRTLLTTLGTEAAQRRIGEVPGLRSLHPLTTSTATGEAILLLDALDLNDVERAGVA